MIKRFRPDCATLLGRAIASEPLAFSRNLLAATVGDNFPDWFRGEISRLSGVPVDKLIDGDEEPRLPDVGFTEKSFCDAPKAEMKKMRETWRGLTPREASSPAVWTHINLRLIESGLVEPWFFVNPQSGRKTIEGNVLAEKALHDGDEKEIKGLARGVSRFLTGYVPERSIRPLFYNCPPARAWWMWHFAEQTVESGAMSGVNADDVLKIIHQPWVWGELTEKVISQLTVIGDVNIRHGIVRFLLLSEGMEVQEWLRRNKHFRALLVGVGEMSSWRALGFLEPERISDIVKDEVVPNISAQAQAEDNDEEDDEDDAV